MDSPLLDPALLSRLLGRALGHGGEFAEVYVQKRRSTGLELDDGQIRSASSSIDFGVGIRVITGASVAYAYSDDLTESVLFECADAASRVGGSGRATAIAKPLANHARPHHTDPVDAPSSVDIERRLALLRRADQAARSASSQLEQVLGGYGDVDEDILIANTDGLFMQDRRVLCRMSLEVIVKDRGGERRVGSSGGGSRTGVDHYTKVLTPERIADEAVRMATAQLGARPCPAGEQVVVLAPASPGVLLHEAMGHGLEADFIRKRTSLFAGRLGEKVASEHCTIIDDGTIAGRRGSLNVDDEGHPTKHNVLIEKGVLKGFINDRLNAQLLNVPRTGNGRRQSFRHPPLPRMTNTFMAAGDDDPEEIVRSVANGVYCRAVGGGQVDIANGNFVFEVREGYLIEDGKITAPVQGATLVGNGPDTLAKVSRVGRDADLDPGIYTCGKDGQSVPVGVGLPTIRIDGITVGGTGR